MTIFFFGGGGLVTATECRRMTSPICLYSVRQMSVGQHGWVVCRRYPTHSSEEGTAVMWAPYPAQNKEKIRWNAPAQPQFHQYPFQSDVEFLFLLPTLLCPPEVQRWEGKRLWWWGTSLNHLCNAWHRVGDQQTFTTWKNRNKKYFCGLILIELNIFPSTLTRWCLSEEYWLPKTEWILCSVEDVFGPRQAGLVGSRKLGWHYW